MSSISADIIPFAKTMGVEIVEASPERVSARLLVRPELCTTGGTLHGGAAMALADTLGAIGAHLALPPDAKGTTTLESKTNFLGAAKAGATVSAETTPIHAGRTTSVWQTKITGEDGKTIALVIQTQLVLR
ncbi:MAG TPA: PaaI family thioesterase [Vitreimonas sp.]|uniref:PaaI family thioesterase n=1 Tax=Vitreimonas sp. TaxID=3069702 RepID=UPI002D4FC7AB|nr:PaaI family thioesterase [Vitreimonas sp.]HYD88584.1 PaaI family thioesterase [Vitreimonas sp.]